VGGSTSSNGRSAQRAPSGALKPFVRAVVAIGAAVIVHSVVAVAGTPRPYEWLLFAALAIATGSFSVKIASVVATISISDTFFITLAVLFGPAPAAIAIAADSLIMSWRLGHAWRRIALNIAAPAVSMWAGAQAFFLIARVSPIAHSDVAVGSLIAPLLLMTLIYFALNSGLIATAVGLESGQSPVDIWRRHFQWLGIGYMASASLAFCFVLLIQQVSFLAAIVILPMLAVFHLTLKASYGRLEDARRHLADVDRLYLSTVETLAMAIDAKDDVTHSHVRRVQAYAVGMARELGFTDESTLKAIEAAALLHDTGKLAVPEHILNKPGKLTPSEFEKMKLHVDVGADILSLVDFPYPVVPIVRCHHENWDGTGYPRGVKGEAIPIGARILSVVDCFDALTSDRPYRRAMTEEAALGILRERSGKMYDPAVVDMFIKVFRDIPVASHDAAETTEVMQRIAQSKHEAPAPVVEAPAVPSTFAASSNLLACVSLARVAGGEGSLADVLALSSNLVNDILPAATGAWFVPDQARDQLVVADAFGPAAAILAGFSVDVGDRLTGWVAASRQPILNSDASLDLGGRQEGNEPRLLTCMSVPLVAGETLVGVLSLYSAEAEGFNEDRGRLIQMIAPHLATAISAAARNAAAKGAPVVAEKAQPTAPLRLVAAR
jgi:putative nucleotidyltransferase with HDIG domain